MESTNKTTDLQIPHPQQNESGLSNEQVLHELEQILRKTVKSKTLTDDSYPYMALLINEDCPKNAKELLVLICDFLTDGMCYEEDDALKVCELLNKQFREKKLLKTDQRDTIIAEKLQKVVVINDMGLSGSGTVREDDFMDPFIGLQRQEGNYNSSIDRQVWERKKQQKELMRLQGEQDALDKKIQEFKNLKSKVPEPEVKHDLSDSFKTDLLIQGVTVIAGGKPLLEQATLKLVKGRKYGLVGRNGIGKTTLINAICRKEVEKLPKDIHILQVEQEIQGDEKTVIQHVLGCDVERTSLLNELNDLIKGQSKDPKDTKRIVDINERLEVIQANMAESKALKILNGLGFQPEDMNRKSNTFSGGWRMRIAIAKVIFSEPEILLLDEPTNHLDLNALIWLEDYIQKLDITVIIVSHAREFLNLVVEEIIHFQQQKLFYYKGNFNTFEKTKQDKNKQQQRQRDSQMAKISHMQKFVDKFRYNAKRATMAQSRIKAIDKIQLADEVFMDPTVTFQFPNPEKISPPLCRLDEARIGYDDKTILARVNINIDLETRIALIGPNGAGKSTLIKTLFGDLDLIDGYRFIHGRLRIGVFTQHHMDLLDMRLSAVEQMVQKYPDEVAEKFRMHLGSFGITGNLALRPMYLLSGGQKSRVAFAMITWEKPHILLLDEPTNHLDFDAINALIVALHNFEGGLVVVSHDSYFLSALCDRLYVVNNKKVEVFDGGIEDYRKSLLK